MALLDSCLCCSLMVASFVVAVYDLVAYVIAFAIEFWWIMAAEEQLPAPAHVLCIEYFFSFILCAILLHGLSVRRGSCLMLWMITTIVFILPEASLVLYMGFQHWRPNSLYGLTELTCWACRLLINVAGLVSVQSLHATWREEKHVMKRLHDLNMSSVASVDGRRSSVSSSMANRGLHAHVNDAFLGSTPHLNGHSKAAAAGSPPSTYSVPISRSSSRLKRSASSASRRSKSSVLSAPLSLQIPLGGSAAHSPTNTTPLPLAPGSVPLQRADSASEFNAAAFDGLIAAAIRGQHGALPLLPAPKRTTPVRSRSMMDLPQGLSSEREAPVSRIEDYWGYGGSYARSLDRRGPRRCASVADLRPFPPPAAAAWAMRPHPIAAPQQWVYVDPYGRPLAYPTDWYVYAASRNSLAASSGDLRRYRDVAL